MRLLYLFFPLAVCIITTHRAHMAACHLKWSGISRVGLNYTHSDPLLAARQLGHHGGLVH
jgi:hypothetical protein